MCVSACLGFRRSVASSDKRPTGSTSRREEGKPQQWVEVEGGQGGVVDEILGHSRGGGGEGRF